MSEKFYTILTATGKAKIANSSVLGTKINFVKLKVGDGNGKYYDPTEDQEALVHQVWEGNITHIAVDPKNLNWINIEVMIPANVGGFMIREYGVFDNEGNMLAIAKCAESYKPIIDDGATKELLIKMVLAVSNTENVTLKIDPTIIFAKKSEVEEVSNRVNELAAQLKDMVQDRIYYCGTTSGTNTYTVSNSKITSYTEGLTVRIKIGTASTGESTLNISEIGAKTILDSLGNTITSGGLKAGLPYQLCYNGTNFIVLGKGGGGNATADKILSPYSATVDSGQITGTIPSKAAQSYKPTTSNQIISAGQYLSGDQMIAPITGTATDADVVAGKTYNSAAGILRTGTATMESLGGRRYATMTVSHTYKTSKSVALPFSPTVAFFTLEDNSWAHVRGNASFYALNGRESSCSVFISGGNLTIDSNIKTGTYTFYLYS